jgi:ubiquitin carboxyl-terminal hydrolase 4/11/15
MKKKQRNNKKKKNQEKQEKKEKKEKQEEKEEKENSSEEENERSELSLEGAKPPLSIYTRRVVNVSNISKYLTEESSHGLCGGKNLGNTCFMNSSIACISNCVELTYYFLSGDYKKDINKENKLGMGGRLAKSWGALLHQYWVEKTRVGNPAEFKKTLGDKVKMFRGFGQQDSNEFMNFFIDYLNEDLNGTTQKPYVQLESKKPDETDEECAKRFWECNLRRNDSIITDLFCGQYKSTIICPECGNINITFDPFNTLTLPLVNKKEEINNINDDYEYIDEFHIFYVPKYSIRKPVRIIIKNILKNMNFIQLFKNLGNKRDFIYKDQINQLYFTNISNCIFKNFIEDISEIEDHINDFIFCYDVFDELENIKIPLYFKNSQFPRMISTTEDVTLEELRKKIYLSLRRYIYSPLVEISENKEKDIISQEINNYLHNMNIKDEKIIEMIEDEYKKIFDKDNQDEKIKRNIDNFINDLPFKIYLQENNSNKQIIIIDKNNFYNISKKLSDLLDINSFQEAFSEKLNLLQNYELYVEFDIKSKYLKDKEMNLNSCLIYKSDFKNVKIKKNKSQKNSTLNNGIITLGDCINNFCRQEKLEPGNEWYCPKCKKHTLASKKMELFYLPKILIICFKRFIRESFRWRKNEVFVDFPINNLDMGEYMIGPDKEHSKYNLFAVSQHYGSTGFGHYTAVCKNFEKWYSYNDSSVHPCSENDSRSSAAYVLFYRRETD